MDFFNMDEMALAAKLDEQEKERKMNAFDKADEANDVSKEQNLDTHGASGEGWYGFDLDGTLAKYDGWKGIDHIGDPVKPMVDLIKRFHEEGKRVKIMTARVAHGDSETRPNPHKNGPPDYVRSQASELKFLYTYREWGPKMFIRDWCLKNLGFIPEIVHQKDYLMLELYDDRVKQVVPNEGVLVEDLARHFIAGTKDINGVVYDALHKGRVMRDRQRAYFTTRSGDALKASKQAEKEFDEALDFAAKCVQLGYVPKQQVQEELF